MKLFTCAARQKQVDAHATLKNASNRYDINSRFIDVPFDGATTNLYCKLNEMECRDAFVVRKVKILPIDV